MVGHWIFEYCSNMGMKNFVVINRFSSVPTLFMNNDLYLGTKAFYCNTLKCPIAAPPLIYFWIFFNPLLLLGRPLCAKIVQTVFETDILSKPFCLLAILLCCLHSHDHRHLISKLHSLFLHSFIFSYILLHFFYPHSRIPNPPAYSILLMFPTPSLFRPPGN